jgi:catalase
MAMKNPKGRVNYEPNSWGTLGGPRENPERGFTSFPEEVAGPKTRRRSESFADHYSQARQFFISQTPIERKHIGDALTFELSKCERPDIRSRVVSHLLNIDVALATRVADGLRLEMPDPAKAARPTRQELPPSAPLSILARPKSFAGRKLGILATDGADAKLLKALIEAVEKIGAVYEIVAPHIGGVVLDDGAMQPAAQKIDGGPSVLYDAVAIVASETGVADLVGDAAARDFASDAFAHCKFIGFTQSAMPLLEKAGVADALDEACIQLATGKDAAAFVAACAELRYWPRELTVDLDA